MKQTCFLFYLSCVLCFSVGCVSDQVSPHNVSAPERKVSSLVLADQCEELFFDVGSSKVFSPDGLKKFQAKSGRVMVYDYKPADPGHPTMILIHGLGDDLYSLQKMAEKAERDGFGILRMDLHGHGATLEEYLNTHDQSLPNEIDYRDNVDDIKDMIRALRLQKAHLVGHSLGGGIALKVAEEMPKKFIASVHAMAPYVQRIDKFIAQKMLTPDSLIASGEPVSRKNFANSIFEPFVRLTWHMTRSFKFAQDLSNALLGLDRMKDMMLDPVMQKFLENVYRAHFLKAQHKSEIQLSKEERDFLDARVKAAILVTKGVRGLDYLDSTIPIRKFSGTVQILSGLNDKLVIPDQMKQFSLRLASAGIKADFVQFEGENSSHFFPQLMTDDVYEVILESITRPK